MNLHQVYFRKIQDKIKELCFTAAWRNDAEQ
jgi:hypothetical protein